jgi:hypothetical protein
MSGLVYAGRFEQVMNQSCSPQNIAATATKFKDLEKQYGAYAFGKFAKHFLPNPADFPNWDRDSGGIADPIRQRLTDVVCANLRSATPLPMVLKVGENVDATHDLHVKTFPHNGQLHVGVHMLCPNTSLK